MKSQLLLGLASFFAVVVAQDPATAPPCSNTCIARDTPECLPQDNACKCKSSNWVSIVSCCVNQICVGDYDQAFALAIAQRTCYLQTGLYVSFGSGAQCDARSGAGASVEPNTATAYSSQLATETLTTTIFTASPTTLTPVTLSSSVISFPTFSLPPTGSGSSAQSTSSTNPGVPAPAGGLPDIVKIALGVGLGVGGTGLLIAIFAVWYRVRRARAKKSNWALPPTYSETKLPPSYSQTKLAESRDVEVPKVEEEVK